MSTVKDKMTGITQAQPNDASYDEIMRELAFERRVAHGLEGVRQNRVITDDEMERLIGTWQPPKHKADIAG